MKSFAFALVAAAGIASAQDLYQDVPKCALACLDEFVPQAGCGIDDAQCQCSGEFGSKLTPLIMPCLMRGCSSDEISQALDAANSNCADIIGGSSSSPAPTSTSTRVTTSSSLTFASSTSLRHGNSTATTSTRTSVSSSVSSSSSSYSPTSISTSARSTPTSINNDNSDGQDDAPGAGAALAPAIGGVAALMLGCLALL